MIVDGAHAIGQVSIDFARLDVDFYTSNLHKWCFVPRSCAFLYAKKLHQAYTHPVLVSHGYHTDFVTRFVQQGTKDDTCWQLVAPMAQYVRTSLGGFDAVWQYERALAARIAARLEHAWRRPMAFDAGHRAAMLLAELPDALHAAVLRLGRDGGGNQLSGKHAYGVMSYLYHQHSVVAPVLCWGQRLYVRICVMPFNVLDDVERLISGSCMCVRAAVV
jgi:isopenicillin-N epimerase